MAAKLTPKGAATRDRIIQGASAEIRENGVTATLDDIRVRTGTSKSQLFHYFPDGREQLLLAVARYEADRVLADQQPQLGDLTSWASWRAWRDAVVARYREQGQQCPLSALTTQLGRATPGAQAVVSELIGQWQAEIAAGVTAHAGGGRDRPGSRPRPHRGGDRRRNPGRRGHADVHRRHHPPRGRPRPIHRLPPVDRPVRLGAD